MSKPIKIGKYLIGHDNPCFIIAEAGVNHNGNMEIAHKLIEKAAEAGADAVKFQHFKPEELTIPSAEKAEYQVRTTGNSEKQLETFRKLELSFEQHAELKKHCQEKDIIYLCTPYDRLSAEELVQLNTLAIKVASSDVTNIPFIEFLSEYNLPVIISTGMCTLGEVEVAVNALNNRHEKNQLALLHCTAEYPAPVEQSNLLAINTLKNAFNCPVGFSDHTEGLGAGPWSVLLGADILEKHFTLNKSMEGLDHQASIEPDELEKLISTVRTIEKALGDGVKKPMQSEISNKERIQKSIVTIADIQAGEVFTSENLGCKRPGSGLSPLLFHQIVGQISSVNIPKNTLLKMSQVSFFDEE